MKSMKEHEEKKISNNIAFMFFMVFQSIIDSWFRKITLL
jgi:hypothetical protein